jgi:hypothetical protein
LTKQTATATGMIKNQPGGKPKTSRRVSEHQLIARRLTS